VIAPPPSELRALPFWVCYKTRPRAAGEGLDKVPHQPDGKPARSNDPRTWSPYEAVQAAVAANGHDFAGVGLVLSREHDVVAIDLDHCLDESGKPSVEALEFVKRFDSYTEVSPSGRGLHLFLRTTEKPSWNKKKFPLPGGQSVEVFSSGQFCTVTGQRLAGDAVEPRGAELRQLLAELEPDPVARRLPEKPRRLFLTGDWKAEKYESQSQADLALVGPLLRAVAGDRQKADQTFRKSGLMRPKWDERHGEKTYGEMTLDKAAQGLAAATERLKLPVAAQDDDLSRRVAEYGDLLFSEELNQWYRWRGDRWEPDVNGLRYDLTFRLIADLTEELPANYELALKGLQRLKNFHGREAVLNYAKPRVRVKADELDHDPWLLGLPGGVLDLRTGDFRGASRADLITKQVGAAYDQMAEAPAWQRFLEEVLPDPETRAFVCRAVGYSLVGVTTEHVLLFCYGGGGNGKSTFFEVLSTLFGDYAGKLPAEAITLTNQPQHPTAIADLRGKRFVVTSETQERRLNEGLVKDLTGADKVTARRMRENFTTFKPTGTFWAYGNAKPTIRSQGRAIWRRLRLIPFTEVFEGDRDDKDLTKKLTAELPGVLNWALAGLAEWRERGLGIAEAVTDATREYQREEDELGDFIGEHVEKVDDPRVAVPLSDLYEHYVTWAIGRHQRNVDSVKRFAATLRERGLDVTGKGHDGRKVHVHGVRVREPGGEF
jgi:putative DNA primase/helicase